MKLKIILSVYLVIIVGISATLATKNRFDQYLYLHQAGSAADACTLKSFGITTNPVLGNARFLLASTTAIVSGCRVIQVYDGN